MTYTYVIWGKICWFLFRLLQESKEGEWWMSGGIRDQYCMPLYMKLFWAKTVFVLGGLNFTDWLERRQRVGSDSLKMFTRLGGPWPLTSLKTSQHINNFLKTSSRSISNILCISVAEKRFLTIMTAHSALFCNVAICLSYLVCSFINFTAIDK